MDTATAATLADLRQQLEQARSYIDGNDVRSDYKNVTEMRAALDAARQALNETDMELARATARAESLSASIIAACSGSGCLNAHELRVALDAAQSEISGFKYMMQRGQDWMNSAHDSWQTMLRKRDEALEELKKALADNATLNTAKDQLIDARDAYRDALQTMTTENNATFDGINKALDAAGITFLDNDTYAACIGRLVAERDAARKDNAACLKELDAARSETDRIRAALQREYDYSKNLESSLAASKAREEAYRADVVRLTEESTTLSKEWDMMYKIHQEAVAKFDRERSRAKVLAAEVRAWREFEDVSIDTSWHNAWCDSCDRIETVKSHTDRTNALDPGKFEVKP